MARQSEINSKAIAARIPMVDYIRFLKEATENNMSISDWLIVKIYDQERQELIKKLSDDNIAQKKKNEQLEQSIVNHQDTNKKLEDKIKQLEAKNKQLDDRVKQFDVNLKTANDKISQANAYIKEYRDVLNQYKTSQANRINKNKATIEKLKGLKTIFGESLLSEKVVSLINQIEL